MVNEVDDHAKLALEVAVVNHAHAANLNEAGEGHLGLSERGLKANWRSQATRSHKQEARFLVILSWRQLLSQNFTVQNTSRLLVLSKKKIKY